MLATKKLRGQLTLRFFFSESQALRQLRLLLFLFVSLLIAFVQSHPTTDLRVLEPITDLTPRDVVDKEVDRVAQNSEQPICNIMSTGHNISDGEEPVPVNRHYDTRVVASDIIASTNELIVGPQEVEEPLVTGTDFAFHSRDRGLQASLGTSYMASFLNFDESNMG